MTPRSHDPASSDHTTRAHDHPHAGAADTPGVEETHPGAPASRPAEENRGRDQDPYPAAGGGTLGSAWIGLVLGALVTILLLIFIVQNSMSSDVQYFGWSFALPLGVLVLFAAIAGALIMAMFAGFRILQLRMRAHRTRKLATGR